MDEQNICPVCKYNRASKKLYSKVAVYKVDCPRCGKFNINYHTISNIDLKKNQIWIATLSHWIRMNQGDYEIELTLDKVKEILENNSLPNPNKQLNNLLLYLGSIVKQPSKYIEVITDTLPSIIGCIDEDDVYYHWFHLQEMKLIEYDDFFSTEGRFAKQAQGIISAIITHAGWERIYELQRSIKESHKAFMAMKFGNKTLDRIFNDVIKKAVSETGFDIRKLDEEKRAGLMDDKLRVEIHRSRFLIADLTDNNNGAYWEAGYAEGLGMPVIYICEEEKFKKEKSHFDTNHHLTVPWKDGEESLKQFAVGLKATIRATFPAEAKMED